MASLPNQCRQYLMNKGKTLNEATAILDDLKQINLQDDGTGAYIKIWNVTDIDKPSNSDLAAVDSDANKLEE